jgi:hypothetical protein
MGAVGDTGVDALFMPCIVGGKRTIM